MLRPNQHGVSQDSASIMNLTTRELLERIAQDIRRGPRDHVAAPRTTTVVKKRVRREQRIREQFDPPPANLTLQEFNSGDDICKYDWINTDYVVDDHLNLSLLPDDAIIEIGTEFLNEVNSTISDKTIAKLFFLAYNLRDMENQAIMPDLNPELRDIEKAYELDDIEESNKYHSRASKDVDIRVTPEEDPLNWTKAICYIAASFLRLYTKTTTKYSLIGNHLENQYKTLYKADLPFSRFHPSADMIDVIKGRLEDKSIFKDTFYLFLESGLRASDGSKNIRALVYDIHVSYSSLHSVTLFGDVLKALGVSDQHTVALLYCGAFSQSLDTIKLIYETFINGAGRDERTMWKYARIFDTTFLSVLQTKNCKEFVYALALIMKTIGGRRFKNVMEISQIRDLDDQSKWKLKCFVKKFLNLASSFKSSRHYKEINIPFQPDDEEDEED